MIKLHNRNTVKSALYGQVFGLTKATTVVKQNLRKMTESGLDFKSPVWCSQSFSKNWFKMQTRYAQLAYGFFRGVPYNAIESKTREDNKPNALAIFQVLEPLIFQYNLEQWNISEKSIQEWLNAS